MKRLIIVCILLAASLLLCACAVHDESALAPAATNAPADTSPEVEAPAGTDASEPMEEDKTIYYSWDTFRLKYYLSIEELAENSEVIVTGECIAAKAVYQRGQIYTLSEVRVNDVYKGEVGTGDVIQIVEMGGRDNYGEWKKNCNSDVKDFPVETHPEDGKVVIGTDGFYPMKEGEAVLLFLGDTTGFLQEVEGTLYGVIGDTDGKLYLQSDGTYQKPSPSKTDELVFDKDNLTADAESLKNLIV